MPCTSARTPVNVPTDQACRRRPDDGSAVGHDGRGRKSLPAPVRCGNAERYEGSRDAASKHGATAGIAQALGDVLAERGLEVSVAAVEDVRTVDPYDAVIAGSAVYAGHWLKPAIQFVERHADALMSRPVWLFSSGPVGAPLKPDEDPVDAAWVVRETGAFEHRVFAGMLDRGKLSFAEKAVVMALRAPVGDFRDWDGIRAWAGTVAERLGS